jgi:hypothetical protein
MAYPGPFPVVFSGATSQIRVSHTTFSGGVSNTGTIGAGGIVLISGAFISGGGIFDSGIVSGGIKVDSSSKIVASGGATLTVITIANTNTFGGGISNAGTMSAAQSGIQVLGTVTNFAGGVVNNGRIAGGGSQNGIFIGASTASGGIVNSGAERSRRAAASRDGSRSNPTEGRAAASARSATPMRYQQRQDCRRGEGHRARLRSELVDGGRCHSNHRRRH